MFKVLLRSSPTAWVTAEKVFGQVFLLVVFAIQAPMLGPYAFGSVALVMVFIGFWEAVPGLAATDALISIREIDHLHFSTVTATCALVCLALGAVVFELAQPLATALGDAKLAPVIRVMAALPLIQAFSIAPTAAAQRELRFQSTALRTIVSLVAGGVVGLVLTLTGAGVWALVWQALVQRLVAVIVLWFAVPISLTLGISRRHFQELAGFALPVMFARAMSWVEGQIPRLILGIYLGPTDLGLFSLATRLVDVVSQVAIGPRALVARVALRRYATNPEALRMALRQVVFHISVLSFPLCVGGAAVAPTLFHVWLDPRWLGAVVPSQLMLLMGVPYATNYIAAAVILALNRQNLEAGISGIQALSTLIVVAATARFGLVVVAAAVAIRSLVGLPFPILVMRRQCGLGIRDTLLPQVPAFVASSVMGAAVWLLRLRLETTALNGLTTLFILIATGVVIYAVLIAIMMAKTISKPVSDGFKHLADVIAEKLSASIRTRMLLRRFGVEWLLYQHRHLHVVHVANRYHQVIDPAELVSKLRNKNLVFAVTAGRSGTTFVQRLLSLLPDVTSEHEPQPAFHSCLRRVERSPAFAKEFLQYYKLPFISNLPTPNYVELSNAFCKGFLEPLLEFGITPNLLVLRRDPRLTALSYFRRYTVPERTAYGIEFMLSPRYARSLPLPGWRRMTDYQLIFWYALEIERRQREFSQLVQDRGGIVHDVSAADLHDFQCFVELAQTLRLLSVTADRAALACKHATITRVRWNENDGPGWHYRGDLVRDEEEVWRAVSAADPHLRSWVEERYHAPMTTAVLSPIGSL